VEQSGISLDIYIVQRRHNTFLIETDAFDIVLKIKPSGQNRQKNSLKEYGTQIIVPYCQKYIPTDCFFGYFGHWELSKIKIVL